jgi:Immunity protein 10
MNRITGSGRYIIHAADALDLDDLRCFCVALAEHEGDNGFALMFMVPLDEYTDQDRSLGMATYAISDGLGRTVYGGVASWEARPEQSDIIINFDHVAAQTLEIPGAVDLHLDVDQATFAKVADGLTRILAPV